MRTRGGLITLVWKGRWEVYMLTNINPPPPEGILWRLQLHHETSLRAMVKPALGLRRQFLSYCQQLFDESMYLQADHKIVFPHSGSKSWILLSSRRAKHPPRFQAPYGGKFDWGSWKEQRLSHPQIGWKTMCSCNKCCVTWELPVTSTGQQIHPPNSPAVCVLLAERERAQCISAPDVTWACV
jgi:hypothetical protein